MSTLVIWFYGEVSFVSRGYDGWLGARLTPDAIALIGGLCFFSEVSSKNVAAFLL